MHERRAAVRKRVIYGAVATIQSNGLNHNCVVKNLSDLGARIEFDQPTELNDDVELTVAQTGVSYRACVVWTKDNAIGLAFTCAPPGTYTPKDSLDADLQTSQAKSRLVLRRVNELMGDA